MVQAAAVLVVSQAKLEQAIGAVQTSQAELALEKGTKLDLQRQHVVAVSQVWSPSPMPALLEKVHSSPSSKTSTSAPSLAETCCYRYLWVHP